jgi:hypothetical protein
MCFRAITHELCLYLPDRCDLWHTTRSHCPCVFKPLIATLLCFSPAGTFRGRWSSCAMHCLGLSTIDATKQGSPLRGGRDPISGFTTGEQRANGKAGNEVEPYRDRIKQLSHIQAVIFPLRASHPF